MVNIYSFPALRPIKEKAEAVACVPYDVVTAKEARECIEKHPQSFMRVTRPDSIMSDLDPKDPKVYAAAKKTFEEMIDSGIFVRDDSPSIYVYRADYGHAVYTGFVADVSVKDYEENKIRRHELTRYDKEEDRTNHIDVTNANTGLVILLYRDVAKISEYIGSLIKGKDADGTATGDTGVKHEIFRISDEAVIRKLTETFKGIDTLYIADGHHRAKSSVNVAQRRRKESRDTEESERFMAVIFAEDTVKIHGYSRLLADLGEYSEESFIGALKERYTVTPYDNPDRTKSRIVPKTVATADKPLHIFHMYIGGRWYELTAPVKAPEKIIESLDVSDLQERVLDGMLGIKDPRGDKRLDFMGGSYPISELERLVDAGEYIAAFSIQPVSVGTVLDVADRGEIMPPKSTWFEPKVLSGLVIHTLE